MDLTALDIRARPSPAGEEGCRLSVRAKPGARASSILGLRDGALLVNIGAPPVDGAANEELTRFMAEILGVAKRAVSVVHGASGRQKLVDVLGLTEAETRRRLSQHATDATSRKI